MDIPSILIARKQAEVEVCLPFFYFRYFSATALIPFTKSLFDRHPPLKWPFFDNAVKRYIFLFLNSCRHLTMVKSWQLHSWV